MRIKRLALTLAAALTLFFAGASAESELSVADARARLYAPDTWSIETRGNASEAVQASLAASGALLRIITPQGQVLFALEPYADTPYEEWTVRERAVQGIAETTLTLRTRRGETLWRFETRVLGRAANEADEALLRDAASRMVYLGEEPASELLIKPLDPPAFGEAASIQVARSDVPITLDAMPAQSANGRFAITGTTTPGATLRHYLNGTGYERFKADEDGRFSVNVRLGMVGTHRVMLQSIVDGARGTLTWDVEYLKSEAILELAEPTISAQDKLVTVRGATHPGVNVACSVGSRKYDADVDENGLFVCDVPASGSSDMIITVTASGGGYAKTTSDLAVLWQSEQNATVTLSITALANYEGQPCLLGNVGERSLCVLCKALNEYEKGQTVELVVRETGLRARAAAPGGEASDYELVEWVSRMQ